MAEMINPMPIIKTAIEKKPSPYWILLIARPSKIMTGSASGNAERTPNIAPLFIESALPKANKLKSKRFERINNKNTFAKLLIATPFAKENNAPMKAMGIPIKQTYTKILERISL